MKKYITFIVLLCFVIGCKTRQKQPQKYVESKREMRGLWVTSILNLDFPSSNQLTTDEQKQEFTNLLDTMVKYRFNTVIMQIRPSGDALYPSPYEPWSAVLTGTQGKAPNPYYDPLEFMIAETHKRGLDFHAWLNPYRAIFDYKNASISEQHPTKLYPQWFVNYGKHTYYNPALPETRHFIAKIVGDIVRRYDVDAIHMDDYFYPYKIPNRDFPDEQEFAQNPRGFTNKGDWRRDNVNKIIKELRDTIKSAKPWVQFGVSPFGVWRNADQDPNGSNSQAGQTNYDDLYADILLWDKMGWLDYITPQLYWHIGHPLADYKMLAEWWNKNLKNSRLYMGQALYKVGHGGNYFEWNTPNEIVRQMRLNASLKGIKGSMFFRSKFFEKEHLLGLKDSLQNTIYSKIAFPPATKIRTENPAPIGMIKKISENTYKLLWESPQKQGADALKYYLVYMFEGRKKVGNLQNTKNIIKITPETELVFRIPKGKKARKRTFVITRMNKANQESEISNIIYKKF